MEHVTEMIALNESESEKLIQLEVVIERNITSFVDAGNALSDIRDSKLYRETDKTFSDYCKRRWNFTDRYARDLINSAEVVAVISDESAKSGTIVPLPETESQAREVAKVPPEKQAKVWKKAVRTAPKNPSGKPKLTAAHVKRVAAAELKTKTTPLTDKVGVSLATTELIESFANGSKFDRALNLLTQFVSEINPLMGDAKDEYPIKGGEKLASERQDVLIAYKKLRGFISDYRPYAACPYPHGKQKCGACEGLGWLTERQYENVPSNLKAVVAKGAA